MDQDRHIIIRVPPQPLWLQRPVPRPSDQLELRQDSGLGRGLEVAAWSFSRLEHWLSASGWLRAWLRLNLILAFALSVLGVLLLPALARFLEGIARSGRWLGIAVLDLIVVIERLPGVVLSIGMLYLGYLVARLLIRRHVRPRHGHPPGY